MSERPDNPIGTLIRLAGERDQPSPLAVARAREAAESAWRSSLGAEPATRARPGPLRLWALAAGVLALVIGGAWYRLAPSAVPVASVAAVSASATLSGPVTGTPAVGALVLSGTTLETTTGRVALSLGTLSLRVDRGTRLRFDAPDRVTLVRGGLYVDSGGVNAPAALHVATPAGTVRHVGTQFQVAVSDELTRIEVREGRVALEGRVAREVAAGERLDVRGTNAVLARSQPAYGGAWEWTAQTAPALDIENRLLAEFLAWIAREHGWQLRYADAALQARAQEIRLHGSLEGLDTHGMIERVALITGTPLTAREGALVIGQATP
jgi:ferric-dicitrate binding protein FerR (iron transport regulator)